MLRRCRPAKPTPWLGFPAVGAPAAVPLPWGRLIDLVLTAFSITIGITLLYCVAFLADIGVINASTLTTFLATFCAAVTMVQYVAPAPLVLGALRSGNAQGLPKEGFKAQAICNVLGISYGVQVTNRAVLITNLFGLGCQLLFLAAERFVRVGDLTWLTFGLRWAVVVNAALVLCSVVTPIQVLGHAITVCNIGLYATPLAKIGLILATRNSGGLHAGLCSIAVANNAMWTLYALMIKDHVVLMPSIFGYMLSAFQVLVILWCRGLLPFDLSFILLFVGGGGAAQPPGRYVAPGAEVPAAVAEVDDNAVSPMAVGHACNEWEDPETDMAAAG